MDDSYYADGSVVQVGDIVEIDLEASHGSYCGWVEEMDLLAGVELRVMGIRKRITGYDKRVALLHVEPRFDGGVKTERILNAWNFSSDMFVLSSKCDVDMADTAELTEFLEGCDRGRIRPSHWRQSSGRLDMLRTVQRQKGDSHGGQ